MDVLKVFHLSIGVLSVEDSLEFFTEVLGGELRHKEQAYANVEVFGHQITLKPKDRVEVDPSDFHFGFNLSLDEFDKLADRILKSFPNVVQMEPKLIDEGTSRERKKMYLTSPSGYLVELKGYK